MKSLKSLFEKAKKIETQIFKIRSIDDFKNTALDVFRFQYTNNRIYKEFIDHLHIQIDSISKVEQIPFLPIEFFKYHKILSTEETNNILIFESSGTTSSQRSKHYIISPELYEKSFHSCFELFYGNIKNYVILALLPSYLERNNSSLVYMTDHLFKLSGAKENGYFLNDFDALYNTLLKLNNEKKNVLLIGVSFALLEFAGLYNADLPNTTIIETGGMKGMSKELTKEELYTTITQSFPSSPIHSEYGMTELLSQAYSKGQATYHTPPWMNILIRDLYDPFTIIENGKKGGINVIDLANLYSCSFIETKDLGTKHPDYFEIHGRIDNSDIRGCNLMATE